MKFFKILIEYIFFLIAHIYLLSSNFVVSLIIFVREGTGNYENKISFEIDNIKFKRKTLCINNFNHQFTICGNSEAKENETLVMMGGIPTDPSESMFWMACEMIKKNPSFKILILHLPFYEKYSQMIMNNDKASFKTLTIPFSREVSNDSKKIDSKFSHINQSKIVEEILIKLNITKAHFIGHDRGVIVFEYLMIKNKDLFLSLSRGAQVWNYYEKDWAKLAPVICVGPPHRFFTRPWQLKLLFNLVSFFEFPFAIRSEGFKAKSKKAKKGSDLYNRFTHLTYKTNNPKKKFLLKISQTMMQTDSLEEIENRRNLPLDIKIMQFQGEDEFKVNSKNRLISDQPFFGKYNLFRNEIEDLYPNCVSQESDKYKKQFIDDKDHYKKVKLLTNARLNFFALIPDSAHFNVIENPLGCASAVSDFIKECNASNI